MATHYVDNKQLYAALVEYKQKVKQSIANGTSKPPVPNYVGYCILMIANRFSLKPMYVNYSYRDEMVSDGVENCICYIDNFDPEKSNNPFAYFTQIIYYAFLRRILKEKKQLYIKYKNFENSMIFDALVEHNENDEENAVQYSADADNISDFIRSFEETLSNKKEKRKKGIEKFIDEREPGEIDDTLEDIDLEENQ